MRPLYRRINQGAQMSEPGRSGQYRVYGYRWVVLAVFMLVNLTMQMLWIAYAPITSMAATYYGVSELWIGLLAMSFMIAFIPLSLPASWLIDTRGFRTAVGLGVVLMGVFGIARGLAGSNYALVLLSTIGIAVAQPFLLNSWTTVSANWFPAAQRATAVGLITLANLVGTAIGMVLTPLLVDTMSIAAVQLVYGVAAAASAVAFLGLARERPVTPPCPPGMEERALMLDGLKHAFRVMPFLVYLAVVFVGMGVYNGVTTWVEQIVHPRGFSATDAGLIGALMLGGGLIGAVVVSALSDRQQKRVRFLVLGLVLAVPGLLGVAFFSTPWLLYACGLSARVLPRARHADRHAVRGRDDLSHAGGHVQRPHPALRPGVRGLRLRHGGPADCRRFVHRVAGAGLRAPDRGSDRHLAAQGCGAGRGAGRRSGRHRRSRHVADRRRRCGYDARLEGVTADHGTMGSSDPSRRLTDTSFVRTTAERAARSPIRWFRGVAQITAAPSP